MLQTEPVSTLAQLIGSLANPLTSSSQIKLVSDLYAGHYEPAGPALLSCRRQLNTVLLSWPATAWRHYTLFNLSVRT